MKGMASVRDLQTRADIDALLRDFYTQLLDDRLLRHVFVDVARLNLEKHLPVMGDFWERVLFNTGEYNGQPMRVHRRLHDREPLTAAHFERWLAVWNETTDRRHRGPVAATAKRHAARIALAMQRNLHPLVSSRPRPDTPHTETA
jgi:hemoglobin